jgi:hypothetical protein
MCMLRVQCNKVVINQGCVMTTKIGYTREYGEDTIMFMGLAEYITNNGVGEELAQIDADGNPDCKAWVHPKRIVNSNNLSGNMDVQ